MSTSTIAKKQTTCGADGARASTTVTYTFGAGTFAVPLCGRCAHQMRSDLYRWSRAGELIKDGTQGRRERYCGACLTTTRAVDALTFHFERGTFTVSLCERHADEMHEDLIEWSRAGTLLEASDVATLKPVRSAGKPEVRRRGAGPVRRIGLQLQVPVFRIETEPEPEAPAAWTRDEWVIAEDAMPEDYKKWTWAKHALERFIEREAKAEAEGFAPMTVEEVLWAAAYPDVVREGTDPRWPDSKLHIRGHLRVVVNPEDAVIITVVDRRLRTRRTAAPRAS